MNTRSDSVTRKSVQKKEKVRLLLQQLLDDFYIGESDSRLKPEGTSQVSAIVDLSHSYTGQRLYDMLYSYRPLDPEDLESVKACVEEVLDVLRRDVDALIVAEDKADALLIMAGALAIHCSTSVTDAKYSLKQRSSISETNGELLRKVEQASQFVLGECCHCGNLVPPHTKSFYDEQICHSVCGALWAEALEDSGKFRLCRGSQVRR